MSRKSGLPPVFPIVIYNGTRPWNAAQEVSGLLAPEAERLLAWQPKQRYFLLDEGRVSETALAARTGLTAQLLRLERARSLEEVRSVVEDLLLLLRGEDYLSLRRVFAVWLQRVVLHRGSMAGKATGEVHDLEEVHTMLEENMARWKEEYVRQGELIGEARGMEIGEANAFNTALNECLKARFGAVPHDLSARIASTTDPEILKGLIPSASLAASLQEFMAVLEDVLGRKA